jgi:ATP-dependent 26S proteasome regulatory subunit
MGMSEQPELERRQYSQFSTGEYVDIELNDVEKLYQLISTSSYSHDISLHQSVEDELPFPLLSLHIEFIGRLNANNQYIRSLMAYIGVQRDVEPDIEGLIERLEAKLDSNEANPIVDSKELSRHPDKPVVAYVLENGGVLNVWYRDNVIALQSIVHNDDEEDDKSALTTLSDATVAIIDASVDATASPLQDSPYHSRLVVSAPGARAEADAKQEPIDMTPAIHHESEHDVSPKNPFDSIGGLTQAKERVLEIAAVSKYPELAAEYGIESGRHFMLWGPAGTGKTTLVKALASEIDATLLTISSTEVTNAYLGQSAKNVKKHFDNARSLAQLGPVVLFFDEFDSIAGVKGNLHREHEQLINTIKEMIDRVNDPEHGIPNLIVAAATNSDPSGIDSAIIRSGRMEQIATPLPNEEERIDIWSRLIIDISESAQGDWQEPDYLRKSPLAADINVVELAKITEGMSGADFNEAIKRVCKKHFMHAVRTRKRRRIAHADIVTAIAEFGR